ncbi:unnamed protein product [Caenorhabditis auriculariae]|uniref:Uncharacterized protein n=1 Tax=Caenorhabditis auriculariae TaxID=2777116 RepID=A0A8S1H6D0_9PELO|nr:unnamed protein product [Caenorhabditis auriculariae]
MAAQQTKSLAYDHITASSTWIGDGLGIRLAVFWLENMELQRATPVAYDHITLNTRHPVRSGKLSNVESR